MLSLMFQGYLCPFGIPSKAVMEPTESNENAAPDSIWLLVHAEFDPLLRNNRDSIIDLNTSL